MSDGRGGDGRHDPAGLKSIRSCTARARRISRCVCSGCRGTAPAYAWRLLIRRPGRQSPGGLFRARGLQPTPASNVVSCEKVFVRPGRLPKSDCRRLSLAGSSSNWTPSAATESLGGRSARPPAVNSRANRWSRGRGPRPPRLRRSRALRTLTKPPWRDRATTAIATAAREVAVGKQYDRKAEQHDRC